MAHDQPASLAAEQSLTLTPADRFFLLRACRSALVGYFGDGAVHTPTTQTPALNEQRASFVTLRRRDNGELRGCRGECIATQPLIASVVRMTLAAALDDYRFDPVAAAELPLIQIEINVLSPLHMIGPAEVQIGVHGLLVVRGARRGLLLPEVAVEHGMDRIAFLNAVCWKAGLAEDAWQLNSTELYAFEAEAWAEA